MNCAPGVLLVSRDGELKRQIGLALHRSGLSSTLLRMAGCGREALAMLANQRPRLVILDDQLADTRALDLLPHLCRVSPKLLIVYLATCHTLELEREVRQLGVLYYTEKPPDLEVLKRILGTTFAGARRREASPSERTPPQWLMAQPLPWRQR